jgi:hypothetical protein
VILFSAPKTIRDARSGKDVHPHEVMEYPGGEWWSWDGQTRVRDGKAEIHMRNDHRPNGYWQECATWYLGWVWIMPS